MSASSTESFYVPIEVSKILKKRHYTPDYDGRDIPITPDGTIIYPSSSQFKELESMLLPMVSWQDAFRFIRERYGIYAYVKRDTYWKKWMWAFEREVPRGESVSAVFDTIDEARSGLFKRIDEEEIPKMFENPEWYGYTFDLTDEEKEEGKRWRDHINKIHQKRREEFFKSLEKPEK